MAVNPCGCAELEKCGWATDASGSGRCVYIHDATPGRPLVECDFCAFQSHCAVEACGSAADACECSYAAHGCRWSLDLDGGTCVVRESGDAATSCNLCAAQPHCAALVPNILSLEPANDAAFEGGFISLRARIWFDVEIAWCDRSSFGKGVSMWCQGRTPEFEEVSSARLSIASAALGVDLSDALRDLVLDSSRRCGVTIEDGSLCSRELGVPFPGISKGGYRFFLQDTIPPTLMAFVPQNGISNVPLDNAVELVFDEDIVLGAHGLAVATLSRLEVGSYSGEISTVYSETITLGAPRSFIDGRFLTVKMDGRLSPASVYTLSLPQGSLVDKAGNAFVGLLPNAYTFETTLVSPRSEASLDSESGPSMPVILAIVFSAVAAVGVLFFLVARAMKQRSSNWSHLREVPYLPKPSRIPQGFPMNSGGTSVSPSPTAYSSARAAGKYNPSAGAEPDGSPASGGAWAYRAPGGARSASEPPAGRKQANGGASASASASAGASASGGAANGASQPSASSGGSGPSSGPGRGAKPAPTFPGPRAHQRKASSVAASPTPEPSGCPEVLAVEKKLRDMMDKPIDQRKKMLKDLMLEFHPDKNHAAHAKEVFQFINNSKSWFLQSS